MKRGKADPDCVVCGGTGEVDAMERVYPGEPHMAPVGTEPCECTFREEANDE